MGLTVEHPWCDRPFWATRLMPQAAQQVKMKKRMRSI
jgi:hypothetical protein